MRNRCSDLLKYVQTCTEKAKTVCTILKHLKVNLLVSPPIWYKEMRDSSRPLYSTVFQLINKDRIAEKQITNA